MAERVKIAFELSPQFDFCTEDYRTGAEVKKVYDSDTDAAEIPNPVKELFQKYAQNRFEKAAGNHSDSAWDEPIGAPQVVQKKTKVARYEVTTDENGERVSKGYDAAGELIAIRWLLND